MKTKNYFNLIEISLAIAVLAIGLSSIMVLFPVGIKANSAAIVDNNLPDIAGQFIGTLQTQVAGAIAKERADFPTAEIVLYNILKDKLLIPESLPAGDSPTGWTVVSPTLSYSTGTPRLYRVEQTSEVTVNGSSETVTDFSAEIRLGLDNYGDFFYNGLSVTDSSYASELAEIKKYFVGVNMEISWPTDIPYAKRKEMGNLKTFRLEFYNNPQ